MNRFNPEINLPSRDTLNMNKPKVFSYDTTFEDESSDMRSGYSDDDNDDDDDNDNGNGTPHYENGKSKNEAQSVIKNAEAKESLKSVSSLYDNAQLSEMSMSDIVALAKEEQITIEKARKEGIKKNKDKERKREKDNEYEAYWKRMEG